MLIRKGTRLSVIQINQILCPQYNIPLYVYKNLCYFIDRDGKKVVIPSSERGENERGLNGGRPRRVRLIIKSYLLCLCQIICHAESKNTSKIESVRACIER